MVPFLNKPFVFFGHSLVELPKLPNCPPDRLILARIPSGKLRRLNGTPSELLDHEELMEIRLPLLRADFAVYETYVYSTTPPLNCPIFAFGRLQGNRVKSRDFEAGRAHTRFPPLQIFPGDRFFLKQRLSLRVLY